MEVRKREIREDRRSRDYLAQYGNFPTDTKPRGGNAYNIQKRKRLKAKDKGKGKGKPGKGKELGNGRLVYWDEEDVPADKRARPNHQASSVVNDQDDEHAATTPDDTDSVRSHHLHDPLPPPPTKYMAAMPHHRLPNVSSASNPDANKYCYCHFWNCLRCW
jgi:hypothetical protein